MDIKEIEECERKYKEIKNVLKELGLGENKYVKIVEDPIETTKNEIRRFYEDGKATRLTEHYRSLLVALEGLKDLWEVLKIDNLDKQICNIYASKIYLDELFDKENLQKNIKIFELPDDIQTEFDYDEYMNKFPIKTGEAVEDFDRETGKDRHIRKISSNKIGINKWKRLKELKKHVSKAPKGIKGNKSQLAKTFLRDYSPLNPNDKVNKQTVRKEIGKTYKFGDEIITIE